MNNIAYIDILILAMIAVFIINRLRNVLGKKTGNESDIIKKFSINKSSSFEESIPDEVIKKPKEVKKGKLLNYHNDPKINEVLNKISQHNSDFTVESFIDGAKKAFEFIIKNYSDGKVKSLKKLVSKEIYSLFSSETNQRNKKKEQLEISLIGVKEPKIKKAEIYNKNFARIIVKFITEQIQVTKNKKGSIIDGDSNQILDIIELWTFTKNLTAKDPTWILEKIEENN